MIESTWVILAIKLVSVPIFIWAVSSVARRWGPSAGGLLLGLPLTSGPVLFFLTLEQGLKFVSAAAQGTLMGLISLSTSCLVYSRLSFRRGWIASMVGSGIAYFAVSLFLDFISVNLVLTFIVVVAFLLMIWRLMPSGAAVHVPRKTPNWEILARVIAATVLVLLITEGATFLGPHLSGLLTPYPIYATILGVFIHKFEGADACALFLRGVVVGVFTAAVFAFLVAFFIVQLGLLRTMSLALLAVLIMQGILFYTFKRNKV